MKGQIFKIHSDFYYANTIDGVFECKIREILKKQREQIFVGDYVELEQINIDSKQAFICNVLSRKNFITKPKVANIDRVIIVSAVKEPELDFEQLNRFLCFCEYFKIKPVLCFNKNDLCENEQVGKIIRSIYEPLGYEIVFTSAISKNGINELEDILAGNITVLCGASGVGKSSIANALNSNLNLRTKPISEKTGRGTHTTRHCEIVELEFADGRTGRLVDTPGFSHLKFDFLLPSEIGRLFPEILELENGCKFKDCLHETEIGCNIIEHKSEIDKSRYDSYLKFVNEAREYKTKVTYSGTKKESGSKILHNKMFTKISSKKRVLSRRKENQDTHKGKYDE